MKIQIRKRLYAFRLGELRFYIERHVWKTQFVANEKTWLKDKYIKKLVRKYFKFFRYKLSTIGSDGRPVIVLYQNNKDGEIIKSKAITQSELVRINSKERIKAKLAVKRNKKLRI